MKKTHVINCESLFPDIRQRIFKERHQHNNFKFVKQQLASRTKHAVTITTIYFSGIHLFLTIKTSFKRARTRNTKSVRFNSSPRSIM